MLIRFFLLLDNREKIIKFINDAKNTGGGDSDEFYELVIKKITEETDWREGATKGSITYCRCCTTQCLATPILEIVKNAQI